MIVEFIGSTGAGKSTLIAAVRQRLAQRAEVATAFEVIAAPLGLGGITHPTARNLIQEALGLPFFVGTLGRHQQLVRLALRLLARQATFSLFTLNNLRSLVRKLGAYELTRRYTGQQIVLVDEGTVLLPHILFVYNDLMFSAAEIAQLGNLLPLPDLLIYVRAPVDTLVSRALQRSDPPRELRASDPAQVEHYINRAVNLFDELVKVEEIRRRVLIVENPQAAAQGWEPVADRITAFILQQEQAGQQLGQLYATGHS